jgi:molybdopterin-guanine dinucleotide biosynthesis protein A
MESVLGVIIAGGQARRMGGGDKCLRRLGGRPILEWIIERARPQVIDLVLNANGDAGRFSDFGLTVLPDVIEGFLGPLAGILTGMEWAAAHRPDCPWIATFPADAPFFPLDYVARLHAAAEGDAAPLVCAVSGGRTHPVCGLWAVGLAENLRRAMEEDDMRKVDLWSARHHLAEVNFSGGPVDPFFNVNRKDDLEAAEKYTKIVYPMHQF